MGGHLIDLEAWNRKAQYAFFRDYELPFFNLCADVDVAALRRACRAHDRSFALACWFGCQQVVNEIDEFRLRLRPEGVWRCGEVSLKITVLRPDDTFQFCYIPFAADFNTFEQQARAVMSEPTDGLQDDPETDAVIFGTTLPWLRFTSISHPRRLPATDSVPRITFGKADDETMPASVDVHHALMDGIHASRFFPALEKAFRVLAHDIEAG